MHAVNMQGHLYQMEQNSENMIVICIHLNKFIGSMCWHLCSCNSVGSMNEKLYLIFFIAFSSFFTIVYNISLKNIRRRVNCPLFDIGIP